MRVACLVDGFNLYHSVSDAIDDEGAPVNIKWLNIRALVESKYSILNDSETSTTDLFYFSALAVHKNDGSVPRHRSYIRALASTGFTPVYGVFREKPVRCNASCKKQYVANVEKQTDVNLALKLIELYQTDVCDACIIVSGDADLLSAVDTAKRLFPSKLTVFAFPYRRVNKELAIRANASVALSIDDYKKFAFPAEIRLPDGSQLKAPKEWRV